jgi:hypothetical protein
MGEIPGQWALLALASAATQASTNSTNDNTKKGSDMDWLTIVKSGLPMFTLAVGFIGQYWVRTGPSYFSGTFK